MKRYPCEETTLDLNFGAYRLRLWMDNPEGAREPQEMVNWADDLFHTLQRQYPAHGAATCLRIAEGFAASGEKDLAAVQVSYCFSLASQNRAGHMIYTKGFMDD